MRDYRNLPCQNQQPWGRNPNPPRSMRDYRDQWMSAPSYMVPPRYAPPPHPQSTSPMEEAILNLTKLVGNFVEAQKTINAQLSQKIDIMENNVNKRIDGLQRQMEHKFDNLQKSISRLANQQVHQEEESQEEECLSSTMVEEQCQQQLLLESSDIGATVCPWEKNSPMLTEEGSGKEEMEEPQKPTAKATNIPLPAAPSTDQVYTLPTPTAHSNPEAPTIKATPSLPALQNLKKLVAIVQTFATTSKKMAAAHTAWHSGWIGCRFGFGAPEPRHIHKLHQFQQLPKA